MKLHQHHRFCMDACPYWCSLNMVESIAPRYVRNLESFKFRKELKMLISHGHAQTNDMQEGGNKNIKLKKYNNWMSTVRMY